MKIALAIENFSMFGGGAEAYAVQLANTLVADGWEVHLYGYNWDGVPAEAHFHRLPQPPRWIPPSVKILHFAFSHRRMVQREDFDVIVGFGNTIVMNVYQSHGGVHYQSTVRKLRAVRNPITRFMKGIVAFLMPKYYARAWIESAAFRMRPRPIIVAIAEMVRRDIARHFGLRPDEIRLVYNGIDPARARVSAVENCARFTMRRSLGFKDEVVFLFMAYDFRKKGVRYLVEAAGALRDKVGPEAFRVLVVGGSPSHSLRSRVSRRELDRVVTFHGPTREPHMVYAASDVFVLPTFYDACSLVVFEAMAAGLPVITTVFNGAAGIVTEGVDGKILKDPSDTEEMAAAMEFFLDAERRNAAAGAAERTAKRYTLEENHRQMLAIFREAAVRHRWKQSR
ncbi:MAG: glycosyltransferase family 4 protein [Desulfomonile sp.]|nr:glycosyltransferase family 4 protein [Desulfomonile sp.]